MDEYNPNGDLNEKVMYYSGGHPELLDQVLLNEFIDHLERNPDAPLGVSRLIYHNLFKRQIAELAALFEKYSK